MKSCPAHLTGLLTRARNGDKKARDSALETIYDEVRALAGQFFRRERQDHTLQATALVHEAYVRLLEGGELPGDNRRQLLAFIAKAMRHILVDHARARASRKRGGGRQRVDLEENLVLAERDTELSALDEALRVLEELDERKSRVVELRYFGGMAIEDVAEVLDVSPATVKRDWQIAKAWLFNELRRGEAHGE